jgi:colanic acid biosynthesis glycosyl transferase WcaI
LGAKQGVQQIIDAARACKRQEVVFLICGEGPNGEHLQRVASGLPNVRFLPLQPPDTLGDLLTSADIHILTRDNAALSATFPSKLINMLASGRPVIACASPDTEVAKLVDGCGRIVPSNDGPALCQAIEDLADDWNQRLKLGMNARARALAMFPKEQILRRWEDLLTSLATDDAPSQIPHSESFTPVAHPSAPPLPPQPLEAPPVRFPLAAPANRRS